jgi:hypothetical protein
MSENLLIRHFFLFFDFFDVRPIYEKSPVYIYLYERYERLILEQMPYLDGSAKIYLSLEL